MQGKSDERMGTESIGKLMIQLAVPAVAAQIVNVLYNIVDRIYIGHIPEVGSLALTGLGVAGPILAIIAAFSNLVGAGGAPLASVALGGKRYERAEKILSNGFTALLVCALFLTIFCSVFKRPILYLFGATDATIIYAEQYLEIYLLGSVFVLLSLGLNTFITCQGQAKTAMLSVVIGAACNIVLDPIFIYLFGMGVRGAAIATVISQAISAAWVLRFLFSEKTVLHIRRSFMKPDRKILFNIAALGISPFTMAATESLVQIVFNRQLLAYGGDLYVGSMTILHSCMQLFSTPIHGFSMGIQPLIAYNFGAGKNDRVVGTFSRMLAATTLCSLTGCLLCVFFPGVFASFFTNDAVLEEIVIRVLPVYMGGMWIFGVQMSCQPAFVALGQAKTSMFIALLRKVFLLIPLAYIFPRLFGWGLMGVYWAEPVADTLSAACAGTIFLLRYRKILAQGPKFD